MDSIKQGARLGKYSLVAEIARGGMGIVFLAQQTGRHGFRKFVVVKLLKPELAEDEKFRQMFLDEARLAARLNHRNIVQTIEVDEDGDRYFFVMEYLEGRTLHSVSRLRGEAAISTSTTLRIICDVLAGLHYAHELTDYDGRPFGIVHRDISPRNVFLTYDGQVKLIDFGVAKAHGRSQETEAGELKGRVPYMAPEHVSGQAVDRRTDVFSVGVLLREALTKTRTWDDFREVDILRSLLEKKIPPLPPDAKVSPEARAIIEKAMAPDPDDRYATANEMRTELERYVTNIDRSGSYLRLGDHLSTQFATHRAHVQALIEEHVARAANPAPHVNELLVLPTSTPDVNSSPGDSSAKLRPSDRSEVSKPSVASRTSAVSPAVLERDFSIPAPPKTSPLRYVAIGAAFVGLVGLMTAGLLALRDPSSSATPVPLESPVTASTATGRPPEGRPSASVAPEPVDTTPKRDLVEVTLRASPAIATIWIDDVLVGQGPHTAKYDRDSKHVVRVSAEGYLPRTETMTFSSTSSMNVVLERDAGAPPPVVHPRPRGVPVPASATPAPRDAGGS